MFIFPFTSPTCQYSARGWTREDTSSPRTQMMLSPGSIASYSNERDAETPTPSPALRVRETPREIPKHEDESISKRRALTKSNSWEGLTGVIFCWFLLSMTSSVLVMAKLANNDTSLGLVSGVHYGGTQQQSEHFISCHFNPLCFCKYDQKTEIYDSVRRLWQMVGFNQTNFFHAIHSLIHYFKTQPTTYFITEAELNNYAWLLVNASLSPVPQSPAFLVEPGPVFDIECADVPIALIPTEYNAHGVISHVSVSGSKLSMLDGSAFAGLEIQGIRLSRDQLYFISEYAFSSMSNSLSMLDLSGNFLDEIPFAAFKTLKLLEWLNLSNNLVNSVSGDWFSVPISLRKLMLSANSIDALPNKLLGSFQRLHWLDLSSNFIRNLTQDNLPPNLQTLNLMKNRLSNFPTSVLHLPSLSWLFIGGCAIDHVPQDWPLGVPLRQMNQLDMSDNFIQVWPSRPFGSQLTVLDMSVSKNYLQTLPDAAFFSMNIFRLSLGHNRIHMIDPGAFVSLDHTLKYLNLENNRLLSIPWSALANLTSLMHLYIGSNAIRDEGVGLPPGGSECKLTYLGLNGNHLTRIPKRLLVHCPHLFHLNLGYNQIYNLDEFLHLAATSTSRNLGSGPRRSFRNLNTLILRSNPIRTLAYTYNDIHHSYSGDRVRTGKEGPGRKNDPGESQLPTKNNIETHPSPTMQKAHDAAQRKSGGVLSSYSLPTDPSSNEITQSTSSLRPDPTVTASNNKSGTPPHLDSTERSPGDNNKQQEGPGSKPQASTVALSNIFRSEVFPNLHELSLSFCQLSGELESFPALPLTTLEISMGLKSASSLHPSIFNSLRNLEWLALDFNALKSVSEYTFYSNRRLSYVNLEWNRLGTLPPQMFHPDIHQSMTHLRLSHNRILTIQSESFLSFPAVNLDLSYNQITTIEKHAFLTAMPVPSSSGGGGRYSHSSSSSSGGSKGRYTDGSSSASSRGPFPPTPHSGSASGGGGGSSSVPTTLTSSSSTTAASMYKKTTGVGLTVAGMVAAAAVPGGNDEHPGLNVYLNHNRLTTVRAGAFSQDKFNLIDLSHNSLSSFSMDAFGHRTIIIGLNVSHNSLERLNLKQRWASNHIIKFLDLSFNRIPVRGIDFSGLCITALLDLSHNRIDRTEAKIFPANCSLKELNLGANYITTLDPGSFANLRDLTVLDLSSNQIALLPPVVFIRNTKLRSLDLSKNRLRSLPRDSLIGSAVEILNLGSNQFVNLPVGALSQISRRLRRLDMSENSLEHLDSTMFESIAGLVHLNLSHNRLSILPDNAFANLASLRELDLSFNFLRANFKELFHFLPKLKVLRLCGCGIKVLPFLPLPHLVSLELASNGLNEIKMQSLGSLTRLRHLDLSHNDLTSSRIPSWTPLYNLVTLKLSNNPLKSLTKDTFYGLGRLEFLEILNISRLDRFDSDVLSHLSNLRSLAVETHPNIEKYRFRLGAILSSIPHLEELKVIIKEATLSDQLQGIQPKLRKLTITGEKLRRIESNALDGLENCFYIDLSITHTSIDDIPAKIFEKLQSARLDLSYNRMVSLNSFTFSNQSLWFSRGTKILEGGLILNGNDWICDCELVSLGVWLRRWLRESFQSHSTDNIPLVHSMYESLRVPTCTDAKGNSIPIIELYEDTMCHASALMSSGYSSLMRQTTSNLFWGGVFLFSSLTLVIQSLLQNVLLQGLLLTV
ncbi:unnamed protein product [Allacma fusca]|uniref:Chaoptin n=1 Tax=Allacma fusca TaxID=39272 RepID=A0A8J2P3K7_9HEXA|nr:unnamed protein product [Allacma fusca]